MAQCPKCGKGVHTCIDEDRTCSKCGAPLPPGQYTCLYCGTTTNKEGLIKIDDPEQHDHKVAERMLVNMFPNWKLSERWDSYGIKFVEEYDYETNYDYGVFREKRIKKMEKGEREIFTLFAEEGRGSQNVTADNWICYVERKNLPEVSSAMEKIAKTLGKKIEIKVTG